MIPYPVKFIGEEPVDPTPAPTAGQHNDEVLEQVLGYTPEQVASLREAGALGEGR
jgi:crotonobetainyl-CoA:carnitine CoA-transferase CaiB-like acyl-CoA transferase